MIELCSYPTLEVTLEEVSFLPNCAKCHREYESHIGHYCRTTGRSEEGKKDNRFTSIDPETGQCVTCGLESCACRTHARPKQEPELPICPDCGEEYFHDTPHKCKRKK